MTARGRPIRTLLPAMNLYKPNSRIDSQDYTGNFHPRKNLRPWLKPCWRRIATDARSCRGSFSPRRLKDLRTGRGASVCRSGGAGTRRVSNASDTTMYAIRRPTTTAQTTNTTIGGGGFQ